MAEAGEYNNVLHLRLIDFITSNNRLFKCEWPCIWPEFFFEFPQHENLSADFIRKEFFEFVLPRIFNFDLSPQQERYIRLLDEHVALIKADHGYKLRLSADILQEKVNDTLERGTDYARFGDVGEIEPASILIPPKDLDDLKQEFFADPAIQAWASATVATREELQNEVLLPYKEIKKRVLEVGECGHSDDLFPFDSICENIKNDSKFKEDLQRKMKGAIHNWQRQRHPGH